MCIFYFSGVFEGIFFIRLGFSGVKFEIQNLCRRKKKQYHVWNEAIMVEMSSKSYIMRLKICYPSPQKTERKVPKIVPYDWSVAKTKICKERFNMWTESPEIASHVLERRHRPILFELSLAKLQISQ